jgi:hypothetical protein
MHSTPQCLSQLHANIGTLRKRVWRVGSMNDGIKAGLGIAQGFGVAIDVKLLSFDGVKHHLRHLRGTDFAAAHRFVAHGLANELAFGESNLAANALDDCVRFG